MRNFEISGPAPNRNCFVFAVHNHIIVDFNFVGYFIEPDANPALLVHALDEIPPNDRTVHLPGDDGRLQPVWRGGWAEGISLYDHIEIHRVGIVLAEIDAGIETALEGVPRDQPAVVSLLERDGLIVIAEEVIVENFVVLGEIEIHAVVLNRIPKHPPRRIRVEELREFNQVIVAPPSLNSLPAVAPKNEPSENIVPASLQHDPGPMMPYLKSIQRDVAAAVEVESCAPATVVKPAIGRAFEHRRAGRPGLEHDARAGRPTVNDDHPLAVNSGADEYGIARLGDCRRLAHRFEGRGFPRTGIAVGPVGGDVVHRRMGGEGGYGEEQHCQ